MAHAKYETKCFSCDRNWRFERRPDRSRAGFGFIWNKSPLGIAAGLIGRPAAHAGGVAVYALGIFLHFFIATSAATVYYVASRWLAFLKEHWLICGLFYGAAIDQVMTLIVLPLSALQARGPYKLHDLLLGIGVHMITVGLPISFSVWRFGNQSAVSINSSRVSR